MEAATHANRQSLHSSKTTDIQRVAVRGWLTRPTNRSLVARQRYKSLDGGWREDTLWSATKIREFPRNAVREKKMMIADRRNEYCSNSPAKDEEHTSSSNVFTCVPSPIEFAAALRALAQRWSLKLYFFFKNNHMKTFSVACSRLKCLEIQSFVSKKWWTIFLKALLLPQLWFIKTR